MTALAMLKLAEEESGGGLAGMWLKLTGPQDWGSAPHQRLTAILISIILLKISLSRVLGGEESPGVLFVLHAEISSISTRKEAAMGKYAKTHWPLLALVAGVALLTLGANGCAPYALGPGTDCWHTDTGTQQRLKTLPAGAFGEVNGEKSNPVINPLIELTGNVDSADVEDLLKKCGCPEKVEYEVNWLDRHGDPVDPDSKHKVSQVRTPTTTVDTCVRRTARANVQNKGVASQVDIQLVAVRLKSVHPIEVTYGGGAPGTRPTKMFDVFITESGTQKVGKMTLTTNNIAGGKAKGDVLLGNLFVNYDVTFREVGNPSNQFSVTGLSLRFAGTKGDFIR